MRSSIDPTFGDLIALRLKMMTWARRMAGPDAEDLVQTTLIRMLANRHNAPALADIDPWTRVVMLNEFRMERRRNRLPLVPIEDLPLAAVDNPETSVYARQVVRLCQISGWEMLLTEPRGMENNTERTQRRRARIKLQRVAA